MTTQDAFTISSNIVRTILSKMAKIGKVQTVFFTQLIPMWLGIKGRYNFLQMERHGQYSERTYRNHFEKTFDFRDFNDKLIEQYSSSEKIIAFDPSFIPKSGKKTPDIGYYYSGCAGRNKRGLEIGCLAVVDTSQNTAYHLIAKQTKAPINHLQTDRQETLIDQYIDIIRQSEEAIKHHSTILAVDGYFAKRKFVDAICSMGMEVTCRLRKDADLKYIWQGKQPAGRGRPRKHAGKVDLQNIDRRRLRYVHEDETMIIYSSVVYSVGLKRNINLAITYYKSGDKVQDKTFYYFSTNLNQDPLKIVLNYKARFQIEFLLRDSKQYAGLEHCQSISSKKIDFHLNSSLTAISVAKAIIREYQGDDEEIVLSIHDIKTEIHNCKLAELIFSIYRLDSELLKNNPDYQKILNYGKIAA